MRHNKKFNHLGRKSAHRKAMLANMACSLLLHKRIATTLAKAKALRMYVEPLITKSKNDTTHSRRVVFSYLQSKEAVSELFREISPKIIDRPGGYTRILKTGNRLGDNAEMCIIELVDYNENMLGTKETKAKSSSRRRRGGKKKVETGSTAKPAEKATAEVVEAVVEDEVIAEDAVETTDETSSEPIDDKSDSTQDAVDEEKVDDKKE
jgi:large subunit ribosomal protein L17